MSVVIPDSVTTIGGGAFENCTSLTSVVIGDSVTAIGSSAFSGCPSSIYNEYDGCKYLGTQDNPYYALYHYTMSKKSYTVQEACKVISGRAFSDHTTLTKIEIPYSVTSIDGYAFYNCSSLTSVVIPDSVTSIGSSAFSGCSSLTSVVIGNSVTSIGSYAFSSCSSLTEIQYNATECADLRESSHIFDGSGVGGEGITITIGANVKKIPARMIDSYHWLNAPKIVSVVFEGGSVCDSIGYCAFNSCDSLTSVYYKGTASDWSSISIDSGNGYLTGATRYYYSETKPTEAGNYWYYDENGNIAVW